MRPAQRPGVEKSNEAIGDPGRISDVAKRLAEIPVGATSKLYLVTSATTASRLATLLARSRKPS
jgi:hypothetical protein